MIVQERFILLKEAIEKAGSLQPFDNFIDWICDRDKESIEDFSNYLPLTNKYMQENWRIILDNTPPLNDIIVLENHKIKWNENLAQNEIEEIRNYIKK